MISKSSNPANSGQRDRVLRRLQQGPTTVRDFMDMGISRFGARIWELRRPPYNLEITSTEKKVRGQRHITYTLEGHSPQLPSLPPEKPVLALQRSETSNEAICGNSACQKVFTPDRKTQRFCSPKCRFDDWDRRNPRLNFSESTHNPPTGNPQPCESQTGDL